jgi:hypothetical protein
MTEPAMLVLGDEPASLNELRATRPQLRAGYLVVCEGSTTAGLDRLPGWQRMISPSRSFAVWRRCSTPVVLSSSP